MENFDQHLPRHLPKGLFEADHKPAWEPTFGTRYITLPGIHPTSKAASGHVKTRLPLMQDGLMHLDTDPEVLSIAAYPFPVEYMSLSKRGRRMKREHVPDLAVRMSSGQVVFIDYENVAIQRERPWIAERTRELTAHFQSAFGCAYALHDELCLHGMPLFDNVRTMWAHKAVAADPACMDTVRELARRVARPDTLGNIRADVGRRVDLVALSRPCGPDVDLVFTALMQLAGEGVVDIDLSRRFCDRTLVFHRTV